MVATDQLLPKTEKPNVKTSDRKTLNVVDIGKMIPFGIMEMRYIHLKYGKDRPRIKARLPESHIQVIYSSTDMAEMETLYRYAGTKILILSES